MKICATCRKELRCEKNGVYALYDHGHAYPGDLFRCPTCATKTILCNEAPVQLSEIEISRFMSEGLIIRMK